MQYLKLFEKFIQSINEARLSDHATDRINGRIKEIKFSSTGDFKKNPVVALERCVLFLQHQLRVLSKKPYATDGTLYIEDFGEIIIKDKNGKYNPVFSSDGGLYTGNKFVALVHNNVMLTTMLINGVKTEDEVVQQVVAHLTRKYPDFVKKNGDVRLMFSAIKPVLIDPNSPSFIIDLDLSDAEYHKVVDEKKIVSNVAHGVLVDKEMSLVKGRELNYVVGEGDAKVYRKKTIENVDFTGNGTMLISFKEGGVKKFVVNGDAKERKFIIEGTVKIKKDGQDDHNITSTVVRYYVGDITSIGTNSGKKIVKIKVSSVLDDTFKQVKEDTKDLGTSDIHPTE